MKKKILFLGGLFGLLAAAVLSVYYWGRPAPVEVRKELYPCLVYYRRVHYLPRMMIAHIVTVDLTCKNIDVLVTPPEKGDKTNPLRGRTTSQFAREFNTQVAINGDGFFEVQMPDSTLAYSRAGALKVDSSFGWFDADDYAKQTGMA